jgi:hypothetical protein
VKKTILIRVSIGTLIGLVIGIALWILNQDARFTPWRLINSPVKFEHITDASTESIFAETVDNKIYHKDLNSETDCSQWTEKTCPPIYLYNPSMTREKGTCLIQGIKYPKNPSDNVIECVRATDNTGDGIYIITYYALLDDGSIWVWENDSFRTALLPIMFMCFGPLVGFLLSLGFYYLEKRKNRTQTTEVSDK